MMDGMPPFSPDSQILVPDSFVALYVPAGRQRPSVPWAEVLARYELCEDTAQSLLEPARLHRDRLGLADDDIVHSLSRGLRDPSSGLSDAEAHWVARRLQELLCGH